MQTAKTMARSESLATNNLAERGSGGRELALRRLVHNKNFCESTALGFRVSRLLSRVCDGQKKAATCFHGILQFEQGQDTHAPRTHPGAVRVNLMSATAQCAGAVSVFSLNRNAKSPGTR